MFKWSGPIIFQKLSSERVTNIIVFNVISPQSGAHTIKDSFNFFRLSCKWNSKYSLEHKNYRNIIWKLKEIQKILNCVRPAMRIRWRSINAGTVQFGFGEWSYCFTTFIVFTIYGLRITLCVLSAFIFLLEENMSISKW